MSDVSDKVLLESIAKMLADGLKTETTPVPEDNTQFETIVGRLRDLAPDDVEQKLVISGFVDHPVDDLRCLECMYYKRHRKWCALPEIDLPGGSRMVVPAMENLIPFVFAVRK